MDVEVPKKNGVITSDPGHCCVPECTSDKRYDPENKLSFHIFPKDKTIKQKWIHKIRRDPGKHFQVIQVSIGLCHA